MIYLVGSFADGIFTDLTAMRVSQGSMSHGPIIIKENFDFVTHVV